MLMHAFGAFLLTAKPKHDHHEKSYRL